MKFSREQIHEWNQEGIKVAGEYLRCEYRMVELLALMAESRGYYLFNCGSLFEYALKIWRLPENAVRDLVTVARKSIEVPAMVESLRERRATVSKLRKVCVVITVEEQDKWLELVETHSSREVEKAVATVKPELAVATRVTYKSENLLELKTGISEELFQKLERVQQLENCQLTEALEKMAEHYLESFDPLRRDVRVMKRRKRVTGRVAAHTQHELTLRDQAQCTHVDSKGKRCTHRRWLEIHHIKQRAHGGSDELTNLRTLCSGHHRMLHAH